MELVDRAPRERTLCLVCAALGDALFAMAWAEGRALLLEEAVALALEGAADGDPGTNIGGALAAHPG